jgi:hypothetical protein
LVVQVKHQAIAIEKCVKREIPGRLGHADHLAVRVDPISCAIAATERAQIDHCAVAVEEWLRADLSAWATLLDSGNPKDQELTGKTLRHWQRDADLTALRGEAALAKLPEAERATWQQFWTEVAAGLKRIPE